jgi:arginine deiminase
VEPLEVEPVLLKVRRDVLSRQTVDVHELHDRLRHRVANAEMRNRVDESLVKRRRPDEPRAFQRLRVVFGACWGGEEC